MCGRNNAATNGIILMSRRPSRRRCCCSATRGRSSPRIIANSAAVGTSATGPAPVAGGCPSSVRAESLHSHRWKTLTRPAATLLYLNFPLTLSRNNFFIKYGPKIIYASQTQTSLRNGRRRPERLHRRVSPYGCEYANIADGWTGLVAKLLQPRHESHHSDDTVHILRPPKPQQP